MAEVIENDFLRRRRERDPIPDVGTRRGKDPCPDCGGTQTTWFAPSTSDPEDVEPRARCTNPTCGWGY